ncbi:hypothetical protein D3C73_867920 [compost metagenome]
MRNFLHGGGHFVHGGGHLIGLHLLAVHARTGLLGHGRQLFSRAGDLGDAIADAADQVSQGSAHALDALLHFTQFVAAGDGGIEGQVAGSDLLNDRQGLAQRLGDLAGDDQGGQCAEDQRQQGTDDLLGTGDAAFVVAKLDLHLVQAVAGFLDVGGLGFHRITGRIHLGGSADELAQGVTVGAYGLVQRLGLGGCAGQALGEGIDFGQGRLELLQGVTFGFRGEVGQVATDLQADQHQLILGTAGGLELLQARGVVTGGGLRVTVDGVDQPDGAVGRHGHGVARSEYDAVAFTHLVQRRLEFAGRLTLFLQQLDVFRCSRNLDQLFLPLEEGVQFVLHDAGAGVVAAAEHVFQARGAQGGQIVVELGNLAHPVAAVDDTAQTGPAGQCQYAR